MCQFDGKQQQPEEMCSVPYDHDGRSVVQHSLFMRTIGYLKLETPLLYNVSGTQGLNLYRTFQYLSLHHLYVSYLCIVFIRTYPY